MTSTAGHTSTPDRPQLGIVRREAVMGTVATFEVRTPAPPQEVERALDRAVAWLHWVDETFSTYKPESEVCRFDRGELDIAHCCDQLRQVIALCYRFNQETGGFFDAWASGRFDPSGVVKGWSIERASELLAEAGVPDHLVDGGGDVRLRGARKQDDGRSLCATRYVTTPIVRSCRSQGEGWPRRGPTSAGRMYSTRTRKNPPPSSSL